MSVVVLDASALAEHLLFSERGRRVASLVEERGDDGTAVHLPHLVDAEVLSVLRSLVRRREISEVRARAALEDLSAVRATRHAAGPFLARAWELRMNVTAHDALYVGLAETLDAPLVTCDGRLARASGPQCTMMLV